MGPDCVPFFGGYAFRTRGSGLCIRPEAFDRSTRHCARSVKETCLGQTCAGSRCAASRRDICDFSACICSINCEKLVLVREKTARGRTVTSLVAYTQSGARNLRYTGNCNFKLHKTKAIRYDNFNARAAKDVVLPERASAEKCMPKDSTDDATVPYRRCGLRDTGSPSHFSESPFFRPVLVVYSTLWRRAETRRDSGVLTLIELTLQKQLPVKLRSSR